ncbi:unnamed protein product, partial [Brachionus calyciflorus]
NYLGKEEVKKTGKGRGVKYVKTREKPLFQVDLWSIYSRVLNKLPRTTNHVESWHNAFGNMLKSHPVIYELVVSLRKEQKRTENNLIKVKTGLVSNFKSEN